MSMLGAGFWSPIWVLSFTRQRGLRTVLPTS